jgi:hypothetical protein
MLEKNEHIAEEKIDDPATDATNRRACRITRYTKTTYATLMLTMNLADLQSVVADRLTPSLAEVVSDLGRSILLFSYRYQLAYLHSREHLAHVLNARRLLGEGAEIGVQDGLFSEALLNVWQGSRLYSVDPWRVFPGSWYVDVANVSRSEHDRRYDETTERLKRFGVRSCIRRQASNEAVEGFEDGQLDFVYLDAQHHYEAVKEDVALWYPKVRKGGLLAGHDYLDGHIPEGIFGVKSAVDEFVKAMGLKLAISHERKFKSWVVYL